MYLPPLFEEKDLAVLRAAVNQVGFGTLVTFNDSDLEISHIPMLLDENEEGSLRLLGHLSRNNPQFQPLSVDNRAIVMFLGPDAYISPQWYPSTAQTGRSVPTWNYTAIHIRGTIRFFQEEEQILELLTRQTARHESGRAYPWSPAQAPSDHIHAMAHGVVGFEIPVEHIQGKWKMSQYASTEDRKGAIEGLRRENHEKPAAVAEIMEEHLR
ncbi:FMN-binding negative transcriptional regulator [Pseudomonas agarici]|uniref:FMN-binding negative transcriptional regulator n=1 Tax=Pseudomonas agarici TaxID=46677 RepID=UPI00035DDBD4|nr:FMN-binding negative transcriptional regulator [Pseudomonas agarici]NWB94161.1 FMN-binding negative transcriptional regulator [Pseudomonas agarici]NWC11612.1 FMN-binding negative transcriptional regulator [Pseudomonas agarici]SEL79247.1 negative transcriptional regulator, PaiB family [Pseudomonas agarici]